ncbi:MAG: replication-associated recombination protein A, partial [Parasutterella excrementihominis]
METDLFGNPDLADTSKNAAAEAAKATRKAAPKDQASPLAERLRPKTIDEVVGQKHLLGPGKPLRSAFENAHPHSMILWGPPGVGKTTLARLMADAFGLPFISISAVLGGVKDIRDAVEKATANREKTGRSTVVFVDEVHRFSKSQQDAFLPHVESGLFTFIGATTENPSFEVISALLSRSTVYVLESLKEEDLKELLHRALEREYPGLKVNEEAEKILIGLADGDARRFLNALEVSATMAKDRGIKVIDEKFVRAALPATIRRFDKGGDNFYDQISALHKSVRGSDPDAALYWMCRMLDGGVDPLYIARRLMRMSIEDIGLADPRGMEITTNAVDIYERLGSPEGELALANAVVYLACAPKSVSVYKAFNKMRAFVKQDGTRPVPMHIRNAPTKLMQKVG